MAEHMLANGGVLTDEDIERECVEYEGGTWEGRLENIRVGRPVVSDEPLVTVAASSSSVAYDGAEPAWRTPRGEEDAR